MKKARRVQLTGAGFWKTSRSIAGWWQCYGAAIEVQQQETHEWYCLASQKYFCALVRRNVTYCRVVPDIASRTLLAVLLMCFRINHKEMNVAVKVRKSCKRNDKVLQHVLELRFPCPCNSTHTVTDEISSIFSVSSLSY